MTLDPSDYEPVSADEHDRMLRLEGEKKGIRRVRRLLEVALCEAVAALPNNGPAVTPAEARKLVARTLSRVLADVERLER